MRVGFLVSGLTPEAGGAFTLESSIIEALLGSSIPYEVFVYAYRDLAVTPKAGQHIVRLRSRHSIAWTPALFDTSRGACSWLNKCFQKLYHPHTLSELVTLHKIDLFWFLGGFEPVAMPFVFTELDCQHRLQPEFPEVSKVGWSWNDRENFHLYARRAAYVVTGTEEGARQMRYFYQIPAERCRVIPLPVPVSTLRSDITPTRPKGLWVEPPFLFFPAQFWPHKNHVTLVKALKYYNDANPLKPLGLVFSGADKGNRAHVFRFVREVGLEHKVQILPFISEAEVLWMYDHAVALAFPSLFGPDNLPPLEAFARHCPVITANIPGAKEQLGDAPLYYDPLDERDLSDKIKQLLTSTDLRDSCIQKGLRQIEGRTANDYVQRMCDIMEEFARVRKLWGSDEG